VLLLVRHKVHMQVWLVLNIRTDAKGESVSEVLLSE